MASPFQLSKCLLLVSLLYSTVVAKALPPSLQTDVSSLHIRQDGQLPKEACWTTCELESRCGGGSCSIKSLVARSDPFSHVVGNASEVELPIPFEESPLHSLHKRTFRYTLDPNGPYVGKKAPKKGESTSYVVPILNSNDGGDTYFKPVLPLFWRRGLPGADERAYSQFQPFGDQPFQIGTNGLMGCTVVVLVSNEAVWMAHLWEAYSNGGADSESEPAFDQRVIQFIKGQPVTNPAPSPIMENEPWRKDDPKKKNDFKVYVPPEGPGIDGTKFGSSRGKQTLLFIMAPTIRGARSNDDPLRYDKRVTSIKKAISEQLDSKKPGYSELKYVTLDPDNVPGDEDKMFNSLRGTVLFQYDPNSDGNGQRAWRLWMEDRFTWVPLK